MKINHNNHYINRPVDKNGGIFQTSKSSRGFPHTRSSSSDASKSSMAAPPHTCQREVHMGQWGKTGLVGMRKVGENTKTQK